MKKVNIKYRIESLEQFNKEFQNVLNVFSDKDISHLEITFIIDTLNTKAIKHIVNCIARNPIFNEITSDTIYTFIVIVRPSHELAKILMKIKGHLSRIELVFNEENEQTVKDTIVALRKKKLPCSLLIRENEYDSVEVIYNKCSTMSSSIIYEGIILYDEKFLELLKKWIYDKNGHRINIFSDVLSQILLDYWGTKCQYKSCMTKYFFIDTDGMIYSCKDSMNEICRLNEVNSLNEIIYHENFISLLEQSVIKREKCINSCDFYELCQGGCPLKSSVTIADCDDKYLFIAMREISKLLCQEIRNSDYRTLNPAVREMILSSVASNKLFEKGMID